MYYDPTGHWEVGDEKLSARVQTNISKYTNDYYAAEARGDTAAMERAHKKAQAARENAASTASAQNVTPAGAAKTAAINNSTTSDANGKYITADTWVSVGGSVSTKTTSNSTSSSSSASNAVKPSATVSPENSGGMQELNRENYLTGLVYHSSPVNHQVGTNITISSTRYNAPGKIDVVRSAGGGYDRDKAVDYVLEWWDSYNPEYLNMGSLVSAIAYYYNFGVFLGMADCANFVSQALFAGGIGMNEDWHYYEYAN